MIVRIAALLLLAVAIAVSPSTGSPTSRKAWSSRSLLVRAMIGEDGFPWPIGVADGSPSDDFAITALGSLSLWRFTPLMIEGCPAATPNASIQVSFVLR